MANYANLKNAIQQVIKTNGNGEITGALLQQVLLSIIDSIGFGYQFIGVATPGTNPGAGDQRVFYLASAGTYPNFGPAVVPTGSLGIFYYNNAWQMDTVAFPIGDGTITQAKIEPAFLTKLLAGYVYMGLATTETQPGTPNRDCFYLAGPGTYTNFGGKEVPKNHIGILSYSNGTWSLGTLEVGEEVIIADNLATDDPKQVLSARQGKILGESVGFSTAVTDNRTENYCINAVAGSANFGKAFRVAATYAATGYIDVENYDYIDATVMTGSSRGTVKDVAGYVFYDTNKAPMSGAVTVTGSASAAGKLQITIPAGAKYLRYTLWIDNPAGVLYSEGIFPTKTDLKKTEDDLYAAIEALANNLGAPYRDTTPENTKRFVDAVSSSPTFGQLVTAPTSAYSASGLIDVERFDYCVLTVVSGSGQTGIRGKGGYVFYDENRVPIYGVVTVVGSVSETRTFLVNIPPAAKYLRYSFWAGSQKRGVFAIYDTAYGAIDRLINNKTLQPDTIIANRDAAGEFFHTGARLDIAQKINVTFLGRVKNGGIEGCAVYGKYVFSCKQEERYILSDITDRQGTNPPIFKVLNEWTIEQIHGSTYPTNWYHENTASFTNVFYDPSDELPLVLTSGNFGQISYYSFVYRLYKNESGEWQMTKLYTIINDSSIGWQLTCGNDGSLYQVDKINPFKKLNVKIDTDFTDKNFDNKNIESLLRFEVMFETMQGAAAHNDNLYVIAGNGNDVSPGRLFVYSVSLRRMTNILELKPLGITGEPEDVSIYNGRMYICMYSGFLYELSFS